LVRVEVVVVVVLSLLSLFFTADALAHVLAFVNTGLHFERWPPKTGKKYWKDQREKTAPGDVSLNRGSQNDGMCAAVVTLGRALLNVRLTLAAGGHFVASCLDFGLDRNSLFFASAFDVDLLLHHLYYIYIHTYIHTYISICITRRPTRNAKEAVADLIRLTYVGDSVVEYTKGACYDQ